MAQAGNGRDATGEAPWPAEGVWWRGRVSEVQDFTLGTLKPASG